MPAASSRESGTLTTVHLEYFHDRVRIESLLFDGTLSPAGGRLVPDAKRPGLGLKLKRANAERFRLAGPVD